MSTPRKNKMQATWLKRVRAARIAEGHIRQLGLAVYPIAHGFNGRGAKTKLTTEDAEIIVTAFEKRVAKDGGPKVTDEQADKGTRWLHETGRRLGLPERFYRETPLFYRLSAIEQVFVDVRWSEAHYRPRYTAFYADGTTLNYRAGSWMSGVDFDYEIGKAS
jgi:hypothetical protein